jgi:hypothetical protein
MSRIPSSIGTTSKKLREAQSLFLSQQSLDAKKHARLIVSEEVKSIGCSKVCVARLNSWPLNAIRVLPSLPLGSGS